MFKRFFALGLLVFLAACAVTNAATFSGQFEPPPANSRVLVMTPNVALSVLSLAGLPEPREDWSIAGRDNLATSIAAFVQEESHVPSALDPNSAMQGRIGQIIRLHDAVGRSINERIALPTQKNRFEWTLGDGVQELGAAHNADYALFVGANGTYSSAGRMIMAILWDGGYGGQQAYASLVDLRTGNVVWFNTIIAAPNQDMRDPEGARSLVKSLLKDVPL